jgi:hypothetical protein
VLECLVNPNWHSSEKLVQLIVARQSDAGEVGAAVMVVDLGCLGVKDAFARRYASLDQYEADLLQHMGQVARIDFNLAAKIVREALAYAKSLGFQPHRDFAQAAPYLADADPDAAPEDVPLGRDGKPFYVNGPYDNVAKIVAQLNRSVGPGNYDYVILNLSAAEIEALGLDPNSMFAYPLDSPKRRRLRWRRS